MSSPKPKRFNNYTWSLSNKLDKETLDAVTNDIAERLNQLETTVELLNYNIAVAATRVVDGVYNNSVRPQLRTTQREITAIRDSISLAQDKLSTLQTGGVQASSVTLSDINGLTASNVQAALLEIMTGRVTESQVRTIVGSVVDNAPEALNTLRELATALGNDRNFASSVTNQLSTIKTSMERKADRTAIPQKAWYSLVRSGTDDSTFITPMRLQQRLNEKQASQTDAEQATSLSKTMSPLRTRQAIDHALDQRPSAVSRIFNFDGLWLNNSTRINPPFTVVSKRITFDSSKILKITITNLKINLGSQFSKVKLGMKLDAVSEFASLIFEEHRFSATSINYISFFIYPKDNLEHDIKLVLQARDTRPANLSTSYQNLLIEEIMVTQFNN